MGETVMVDGEAEYTLVFDVPAAIFAEGVCRKTTDEMIGDIEAGWSFTSMRAVLYGALQAKHQTPLPQVDGIIQRQGPAAIKAVLIPLLANCFGLEPAGKDDDADPPKGEDGDGTGSASSPSGAKPGSSRKASGHKPRG
ncbi:hypothetical protein K9B33_20910 [Sphingobium sp. 3R8]|uniref:hypothetical protein n=1 Tax=Sphingobium sp. 3R8 TaxID=2874921 RepID=UPI001CCCC2A2|nr:hypothetical protein [Sphingobium sp. 3R8]MBZ9649999.1 hypothetical protein [Sphingobium sp. 3R8]